jgi:hypothetical protein
LDSLESFQELVAIVAAVAVTPEALHPPADLEPWTAGIMRRLRALPYRRAAADRDIRLDFLRGWCIFSMVVDHAAGQRSSPIFALTGNGPWPITGAHGFVMLSGVVMGLLYAGIIRKEGERGALQKLAGRALKLYMVAVALGLFDIVWTVLPWIGGGGTSFEAIRNVLLLHSGSDDLMTFYFILVILAGPVLLALHRRLWPLALGTSIAVWLVHNHDERLLNLPVTYFVPVADWQLIFVVGLLIGYHREAIGRWLRGPLRTAFIAGVMAIFALTVLMQSNLLFHIVETTPGWLAQVQQDGWQGYDHNPPLHMLLVFGNLTALYYLVSWLWAPLARVAGWFFIPLGQAALYVYIVHSLLVFYLLALTPLFGELQGLWLTVSLLGLMLVIWVMVKKRFLFSIIPR